MKLGSSLLCLFLLVAPVFAQERGQATTPPDPAQQRIRALEEELKETFELLLQTPQIGILVPTRKQKFMRRIFLPRTRYYVYYRNTAPGIEILALWHASRRPPRGL